MKKTITLLLAIILSNQMFCQIENNPDWSMPSEDYYKTGKMMTTDSEGNAILVGDRPAYLGNSFIFTQKYNVNGELLWERTDSSGVDWVWHKPRWVNTDSGNNVYVAGYQYTGTSDEYTLKIVAIKYDENGNLIWRKIIDHTWPSALPMRSELDDENNFYIGTVGLSPGFRLLKLDNDGNILVDVSNASSENQSFTSMRLKDDMIVMTSYAGNGATLSATAFDTSGNFLWSKMITSRGGMDVEIDDNHNVYLLSQKDNQVSAQSNRDLVIFKLNEQGDLIDTFAYDFGNSTEFASRMTLVNNKISIIGQTIGLNQGYMDWLTLQIDLDGNTIWSATYDYMESNDEAPFWISALENGEVYVSGKGGPAYIDFNGSQYLQYVTLRYNNGNIVWRDTDIYQGYNGIVNAADNECGVYVLGETSMTLNHYADECITLSTNEGDSKNLENLSVYPNPASDKVTIPLNAIVNSEYSIAIVDAMGTLVEFIEHNQQSKNVVTIDVKHLASGVYNIILQDGENMRSEKMIKL